MNTSEEMLAGYLAELADEEKSPATIEKYARDIRAFMRFMGGGELTKGSVIAYKHELAKRYRPTSVNSMLAAVNKFLDYAGCGELRVKQLRVQHTAYCADERELSKEEYRRLLAAAQRSCNRKLLLIMETICATGIRVSELPYITVEAVMAGEATVRLKGKTRRVFIPPALKKNLLAYIRRQKVKKGTVFVTRSGKPMDRSNIWRAMKGLCGIAGVNHRKVFPHNLRHLFARTYYGLEKDIAKLADILGHSSIETTRIYIMSTGAEHRRQVARLGLTI